MSGRLIILPKKSYCPWNPDNVARVERDERLHREQQQKRETTTSASASTTQLLAKRKRDSDNEQPKHVNLFQKEQDEAAAVRQEHLSTTGGRRCDQATKKTAVPFYMTLSLHAKNDKKEEQEQKHKAMHDPATVFMSQASTSQGRSYSDDRQSRHRSDELDANKSMSRHAPPREDRRHKRRRRHCHVDDDSDTKERLSSSTKRPKSHKDNKSRRHDRLSNNSTTTTPKLSLDALADLRRRRQEREEAERQRQASIMHETSRKPPRYNDQFHPRLAK